MRHGTGRIGKAKPSGVRQHSRVRRRQNGLAVMISSVVLIVGVVGYLGAHIFLGVGGQRQDFQGAGDEEIALIQVVEGATLSTLGPKLVAEGVVASERVFQSAALKNPQASSLKPGFFRLHKHQSARTAVAALLDPQNLVEFLEVQGGSTLADVKVVGGTVRPGIYSSISKVTCKAGKCIDKKELERVAATVDPAALGAPEWAVAKIRARGADPRRLEGLIAPGQYILDPQMSATEILTDLIKRSTQRYNQTGIVERAKVVKLSPYDLLVAASLVEREAPAGEFTKVARVILNRLAGAKRLEFDSTVNYGLPEVELATTDKARAQVTPWNTYAKEGLPDTPIASPSDQAINAMENPAEGQWQFFVTVNKDGTTKFSTTFEEHLKLVEEARRNGVLDSRRVN